MTSFVSDLMPQSVIHGFGTQSLGDGRDDAVLPSFFEKKGVGFKRIIRPSQYHSTNICIAHVHDYEQQEYKADGVITTDPEVVLTVLSADCVPIMYVDPIARIIGISHQGWKGTLDKLPSKMIQKMKELGSNPEDISCTIGPSIQDCCYEIWGEREVLFDYIFGEKVINNEKSHKTLSLSKANYQSLIQAGIPKEHIDMSALCTSCESDRLWSYQREGQINGEMISYVMLK
jgi:hypothetical protein